MAQSLTYGGLDLLGSTYSAMLSGADLGDPKPITSSIRSLFLDGSIVSGRFSDNRDIVLTVNVTASTATALASAVDALAYQVDQATNTLTWTPASGLPVVFDTFRGSTKRDYAWEGNTDTRTRVTVSFPAWPFGRTATTSTLSASATAAVILDSFEESPEPNYTSSSVASATALTRLSSGGDAGGPYAGTYYAQGSANTLSDGTFWWQVSSTFAAVDISGRTVVQFATMTDLAYQGYVTSHSFTLTLSSASGTSTWVVTPSLFPSSTVGWNVVGFDLTATPTSTTGSGYTATAVTGYTLRSDQATVYTFPASNTFYVDQLAAYPSGYGTATSADAGSFSMSPVLGSAHCPVALRVDRGGTNTLKDLLVYQAPVEAVTGYQPLLVGSSPYSTPTGVNLKGTFDVIASIKAASQSTTQSVAVSIQQTQGGANVGTAWASGMKTTTAGDAYVVLGQVTLPLVGAAATNSGVGYTATVTTGSSVVLDLFLLDTRGSLTLVGPAPVTAAKFFFIDIPAAATGVGGVYTGSQSDESDAVSVLANTRLSGGQLSFQPGTNTLVVCSTQASTDLAVTATYSPRWLTERTS